MSVESLAYPSSWAGPSGESGVQIFMQVLGFNVTLILFQISIPVLSVTLLKKTKTALLVPNALIIATVTDRVSTGRGQWYFSEKIKTRSCLPPALCNLSFRFPRIHSTRRTEEAESGGACTEHYLLCWQLCHCSSICFCLLPNQSYLRHAKNCCFQ